MLKFVASKPLLVGIRVKTVIVVDTFLEVLYINPAVLLLYTVSHYLY